MTNAQPAKRLNRNVVVFGLTGLALLGAASFARSREAPPVFRVSAVPVTTEK